LFSPLPLTHDSYAISSGRKGIVLKKLSHSCAYGCLLATLLFVSSAVADTWNVPGDAPTIQAGIDSATAGDAVEITCGTYYEHSLVMKSGIILRSETSQPGCVIIDAENAGRVITCVDVDPTGVIVGLTLINGSAMGASPDDLGGGILCDNSSPALSNCIFRDNAGNYGGGLYCRDGSSPAITDCDFLDNSSESMGGGLYCFNGSSPPLTSCTFSGNHATEAGGGMYCAESCLPTLNGCTFYGNSSPFGGGITCFDNSPCSLMNCLISFSGEGRAMYYDVGSTPSLECCDLYGNDGGDWMGSLFDLLGTLGNINADPLFCAADPHGDRDWTIQSTSPCLPALSSCGQIGAWGEGCIGTATAVATWGQLKTTYR